MSYLFCNWGITSLVRKIIFLCLGLVVSLGITAFGQTESDSLWSISALYTDADGDGRLDYLGETVKVGGIVNVNSRQIHTNNLKAFLQTDSLGVPLFSKDLGTDFQVGDSLVVTGELQNYDGMNEIYVVSYEVYPEVDQKVSPKPLSVVTHNPAQYIGMLVEGKGKVVEKGIINNGKYLEISVEGHTGSPLVVYLSNFHSAFEDFDFDVHSIGDLVQVKGVVGKLKKEDGSSIYQVYLRSPDDLHFEGLPRFYFIIAIVIFLLVVLAIGIWIVSLRQQVDSKTEKIQESLNEKDVLLREIHHRVKNNLSIISGLIGLQLDSTDDEIAQEVLKDSQSRIKSMALIHDKLYQTDSLSDIELDNYLRELVEAIHGTFTEVKHDVELKFDLDSTKVDIDHVIPCGLLVNELVVNSFKHVFAENKGNTLEIILNNSGNQLELIVADDGPGLPDNFTFNSGDSLGTMLISTFATQLGAEAEILKEEGRGAVFRFAFELE